jgi:AmmeMemoRadiSam system protein A
MKKNKEFDLTKSEKDFCIKLARESIEFSLKNEGVLKLSEHEHNLLPEKLLEKKACFVTLTINKKLKGCIGHLVAFQPLYKDIIENAYSAAFSDPRFETLTENEFDSVKVEVSILTDPIDLEYSDSNDLLKKIVMCNDGLIISKGYNSATFLPSVWEEINSKEEFLSHLCLKAGLLPNEWKLGNLKVKRYYSIKAKE